MPEAPTFLISLQRKRNDPRPGPETQGWGRSGYGLDSLAPKRMLIKVIRGQLFQAPDVNS